MKIIQAKYLIAQIIHNRNIHNITVIRIFFTLTLINDYNLSLNWYEIMNDKHDFNWKWIIILIISYA